MFKSHVGLYLFVYFECGRCIRNMLLSLCNKYQCQQVSFTVWVPMSGVGVKALFQSMPILLIAMDFKTSS